MKVATIGLFAGGVLLAAVGIVIAHPGPFQITPPKVEFPARTKVIPLQLFRGTRVIVPITINGHSTEAMLDTGASMTTLDTAYARSIGIPEGFQIDGKGTGGTVKAELVSGLAIDIGNTRLANMSAGVMDLSAVGRALGRSMTVVLGRDFFNSTIVSINWRERSLQLHSPATFLPPRDAVALPLTRKGPFDTISISVAGGTPIEALFDLGSDGALGLPRTYWGTRPDIAGLPWAEGRRGGVGGLTPARMVTMPQVSLAGRTFSAVPTMLSEAGNDYDPTQMANVGIQFLKQFRIDLDLGHDRVYLAPRTDAPGFDRDRSGARFDLEGDRLRTLFVSPNSPAARAGLKSGDEIVAVDGAKIDASTYRNEDWSWSRAGRTVKLERADGSTIKITLADYY